MKTTRLLCLVLLCTLSYSLSAQWVKQNTPTLEGVMYYLFPTDKNTLWTYTRATDFADTAVKKAEFLRTGDGGKTYKKGTLSANATNYYAHIEPIDGKNAHLLSADVDGNFAFQRTLDSGATWQNMPMQPHTFPDHVHFWGNEGIFIADPDSIGVVIMYTTDGGTTYTRLPQTNHPRMDDTEFPIIGDYQVLGNTFFFWSLNFVTEEWRVWRSLDRGRNWTAGARFHTGTVSGFTARITFTDNNNGLVMQGIADNHHKPLYTEDGGATWKESGNLPSYTSWPVKNIPNTSSMMALFQDTTRKMLYSALTNDLGRTWNTRKDIVPYDLDSIFVPVGFQAFVFTSLEIINNNAAWGRFSRTELYRYDSSTPIIPEKPDLDLTLTADTEGLPLWGYVKFTLTITNRGISKATDIRTQWLPPYKRVPNGPEPFANVGGGAYSSKGIYNSWTGLWSIDELDAGESATVNVHLFVLQNTVNVTQSAQITDCNEADLDSSPNNMTATSTDDDEARFTSVKRTTLAPDPTDLLPKALATTTRVFPNPTTNKVNIAYQLAKTDDLTFTLTDANGRVVLQKEVPSVKTGVETFEVGDLAKGVYMLKMVGTSGEIRVQKIVKE